MSYDKKCLELAKHFLGDCTIPDDRRARMEERLAGVIQHAIDDWIQDEIPPTDRP